MGFVGTSVYPNKRCIKTHGPSVSCSSIPFQCFGLELGLLLPIG